MENIASICGVLIVSELVTRLCPKNKALGFAKALVVLTLLASAAATALGGRWDWPEVGQGGGGNPELEEYLEGEYRSAAEEQAVGYIRGLFGAAGLEAEKIWADINITEDSGIVFTKAGARFRFESDAQRARALLRGALGEETKVEVTADGA